MNGLELLALFGASLAGAVTALVSVALWHRSELAEIDRLKADAARVYDSCLDLWQALTSEQREAAPLSAPQRAALHSMVLLASLRTALARLKNRRS